MMINCLQKTETSQETSVFYCGLSKRSDLVECVCHFVYAQSVPSSTTVHLLQPNLRNKVGPLKGREKERAHTADGAY